MAYEPLHHKYRPQTFQDLVGQETIALTLSNALQQAKIAPAYLFTGPRGTGKTSSARILAKSLNCLNSNQPTPHPCGQCEACVAIARGSALDVMEIDAASNTGVDNIREIIERSRFAPVQCRYKIYAIDECHMLSTAAFNALLKTLEEPPPQVVFILATTDPQRVLSTIISRCQRFDYRRIPLSDMTAHLRYIADTEAIAIADDALNLIAQIANGGLRDAESLLDQLSLIPETITVPKVWDLVGAVPEQDLLLLLRAINSQDSLAVLQQCRNLLDRGREPLIVLQNLASFYLNLLIAKTAPQNSELISVTATCWEQLRQESTQWETSRILQSQQHLKTAETQLKQTTQPRLWLEVTLLGLLAPAAPSVPSVAMPVVVNQTAVVPPIPQQTVQAEPSPDESRPPTMVASSSAPATSPAAPTEILPQPSPSIPVNLVEPDAGNASHPVNPLVPKVVNSAAPSENNQEIWSQVISAIQPPTTQALLKQHCHLIDFDGQSAIVGISSARLQKLYQNKVANIEAAFAQVCQHKVKVLLEVASSDSSSRQTFAVTSTPTKVPSASSAVPEATPEASPEMSSAVSTLVKPDTSHQAHSEAAMQKSSLLTKMPAPVAETPPTISNGVATSPPMVVSTPAVSSSAVPLPLEATNSGADVLQQAINNLTQCFEGELVELANFATDDLESGNPAPSNLAKPEFSEAATPTAIDKASPLLRPDDNEYDDDW